MKTFRRKAGENSEKSETKAGDSGGTNVKKQGAVGKGGVVEEQDSSEDTEEEGYEVIPKGGK